MKRFSSKGSLNHAGVTEGDDGVQESEKGGRWEEEGREVGGRRRGGGEGEVGEGRGDGRRGDGGSSAGDVFAQEFRMNHGGLSINRL